MNECENKLLLCSLMFSYVLLCHRIKYNVCYVSAIKGVIFKNHKIAFHQYLAEPLP